MPDRPPPAPIVRDVLATYQTQNPRGHEDLAEYATCIADELTRLQAEDKKLAPHDIEEMFADPPAFKCPDTTGIVHFMLGYVQGTAAALGIHAWDIVGVITTK
jgi:hypothetical protein